MSHAKLYTYIYVILFVGATVQVGVEYAGLLEPGTYMLALAVIIALSLIKAVIVAGYYQHLRWEQRSLTYLYGMGLLAALALTIAASYSIT
ncbi:MAG: cytochrome C oxidase subunit IV family protein [Haloglomus sp.]